MTVCSKSAKIKEIIENMPDKNEHNVAELAKALQKSADSKKNDSNNGTVKDNQGKPVKLDENN